MAFGLESADSCEMESTMKESGAPEGQEETEGGRIIARINYFHARMSCASL